MWTGVICLVMLLEYRKHSEQILQNLTNIDRNISALGMFRCSQLLVGSSFSVFSYSLFPKLHTDLNIALLTVSNGVSIFAISLEYLNEKGMGSS